MGGSLQTSCEHRREGPVALGASYSSPRSSQTRCGLALTQWASRLQGDLVTDLGFCHECSWPPRLPPLSSAGGLHNTLKYVACEAIARNLF